MNEQAPALSLDEINEGLKQLKGWTGNETGLRRKLVFEEFEGAMRFMQACVDGISARNHHPVWTNKYNSVEILLNTFDIGGKVSSKDLELARFLNSVLEQHGEQLGYMADY